MASESNNGNEENAMKSKCGACGKAAITRCGSCLKVAYCSKECQTKGWQECHKKDCIPLEAKVCSIDKRYHVHLTKAISAGGVIGKEAPLATGPLNTLNYEKHIRHVKKELCVVCCKALEEHEIVKCVKCGLTMCGSRTCAEDKTHARVECPIIMNQKKRFVHYMFIVPAEFIFLLRVMNLKTDNPNAWEKILRLNPNPDRVHLEKFSPFHREVSGDLVLFLKSTLGTLTGVSQRYLLRLLGTIDLFMKDAGMSEDGIKELDTILDLTDWSSLDDETPHYEDYWSTHMKFIAYYGSSAAHSCIPNVTWKFNAKKQVEYRALVDLKAGDEVFITKDTAGLENGTARRRQILHDQKRFACKCYRCSDPTELGSYFSAMKCRKNDCEGYLLMINPLESHISTDWKCNTCSRTAKTSELKNMYTDVARDCIQVHAEYLEKGDDITKFAEKMEKLVKDYEKFAHPNHCMLRSVREKLTLKLLEPIIVDMRHLKNHAKSHGGNCPGNKFRKHVMTLAKKIVTECQYALQPSNYLTCGFTRTRGQTLVRLQLALAFIYHYGTKADVEETGTSKLDLYKCELEAKQILEFYATEINEDAEYIKFMASARAYIPVCPD